MQIAATGFVAEDAGSVASANAVILRGLLKRGHRVRFFTKPDFVDPRCVVSGPDSKRLDVTDCTNRFYDGLRKKAAPQGRGVWGRMWGAADANSYNRNLVRAMRRERVGDVDLWLGDWARGRSTRPVVSFLQGPPGTDARSVQRHDRLITRLAGRIAFEQLAMYARYRLWLGLPRFSSSDRMIVGSKWSRKFLCSSYGIADERVDVCPYPIDLAMFKPGPARRPTERLRLCWLGRFIPRKRLDLFLDGLRLAIQQGIDAEAWIVGRSGFVPGYEKLIEEFEYPRRIRHWASLPREKIPGLLAEVDVMAQPSDEENFGSSVAEALACGVPAIVGATNGTADYICDRSIRLTDDGVATFASALARVAEVKRSGSLRDRAPSRSVAEQWFDAENVVDRLYAIMHKTQERQMIRL